MLLEPQPTAYDLYFELFRTRVRVHVSFWIFSAILGWNVVRLPNGLVLLLIWVLCSFFSILLHEFGHVWAGKLFDCDGYIVLYSFGGLAVGANDTRKRWQRICVSLAGPVIQLALWAAMLGATYLWPDLFQGASIYFIYTYSSLMMINLIWPLFNLLPVWPLDGGMVTREVCEGVSYKHGTKVSLYISIATAGFMAINSVLEMRELPHVPYLHGSGFYTIILFGVLAYESFVLLQNLRPRSRYDDRLPWE